MDTQYLYLSSDPQSPAFYLAQPDNQGLGSLAADMRILDDARLLRIHLNSMATELKQKLINDPAVDMVTLRRQTALALLNYAYERPNHPLNIKPLFKIAHILGLSRQPAEQSLLTAFAQQLHRATNPLSICEGNKLARQATHARLRLEILHGNFDCTVTTIRRQTCFQIMAAIYPDKGFLNNKETLQRLAFLQTASHDMGYDGLETTHKIQPHRIQSAQASAGEAPRLYLTSAFLTKQGVSLTRAPQRTAEPTEITLTAPHKPAKKGEPPHLRLVVNND